MIGSPEYQWENVNGLVVPAGTRETEKVAPDVTPTKPPESFNFLKTEAYWR